MPGLFDKPAGGATKKKAGGGKGLFGGGGGDATPAPAGTMYTVKQRAVVRQGFQANSNPAPGKPMTVGQVVEALETKVNDKGVLRVRFDGGWVSEKAGDGTVLLERAGANTAEDGADEDGSDDSSGSDSDSDSGDESSTAASESSRASAQEPAPAPSSGGSLPKYVIKQRAIMRQGFEATSKPAAGNPLKIGDVVQALEVRKNDKGVLRIRVAAGWVSATAGDGTVLLAEEGEEEKDEQDEEEDGSDDDDDEEEEEEGASAPAPAPAAAKRAPVARKDQPIPKKGGGPPPIAQKKAPAVRSSANFAQVLTPFGLFRRLFG